MIVKGTKGFTYFERWGFSLNEGALPNIHMSWRRGNFFFYLAITRSMRVYFNLPHARRTPEKEPA